MENFKMYLCDDCGHAQQKPGICLFCQVPLTAYAKEDQHEYMADMEEPMRLMSEYKWYV